MTQEVLKLAFEALDNLLYWDNGKPEYDEAREAITAIKEALAQPELCKYGQEPKSCTSSPMDCQCAIDAALAQQEQDHIPDARKMVTQQEPMAWKLMPRDATDSMLKAMDECSTEGYDERLYAGHASSVYMAAWDEAPETIPKRKWVGLTEEEHTQIAIDAGCMSADWVFYGAFIERKLREKNTHD